MAQCIKYVSYSTTFVEGKNLSSSAYTGFYVKFEVVNRTIRVPLLKKMVGTIGGTKWPGLTRLILGSKSWSRRTLLSTIEGLPEFSIVVADIDEQAVTAGKGLSARETVSEIGLAKARALLASGKLFLLPSQDGMHGMLITGDSVVTHKGAILGKPKDKTEARRILTSYSSSGSLYPATTVSSVVVVDLSRNVYWKAVDEAEVYFREMPKEVIDQLLETNDTLESAGALRIEHPLVEKYTECIIGERSSVMGFPTVVVERLLGMACEGIDNGTPL